MKGDTRWSRRKRESGQRLHVHCRAVDRRHAGLASIEREEQVCSGEKDHLRTRASRKRSPHPEEERALLVGHFRRGPSMSSRSVVTEVLALGA
jgi:hypothetical protein